MTSASRYRAYGRKNWTVLRVDNFVTVNGRKAYDVSKDS